MNAERWLNKNVLDDDWNKLEEGINDALWTNNVIEYMEQYAAYKGNQNTVHNSDYVKCVEDIRLGLNEK